MRLLLAIIPMLVLAAAPSSATAPVPAGLVLAGEAREFTNLTIHAGETAVFEGATVYLRGALTIEPGASLELRPRGDTPTRLLAQPGHRFWIDVAGTMQSLGEPRTLIDGLDGHGLDSVMSLPGGIKVSGTARLADIDIQNGTAGLIVQPGARLELTRARLHDLFLMGVASQGVAVLEAVESTDTTIAVTGRGPSCLVDIRNSTLASWAANLQMVNCSTRLASTVARGGDNSIVVNGAAPFTARNLTVEGYARTGLLGKGENTFDLNGVNLEGKPGALYGIELRPGSNLTLHSARVGPHREAAIKAQQSGLTFRDVNIAAGSPYGLLMVNVPPPDLSEARIGASTIRRASLQDQVTFELRGPDGRPLAGIHAEVRSAAGDAYTADAGRFAQATVLVERLVDGPDGMTVASPFTYAVTHDDYEATGQLDDGQRAVVLAVKPESSGTGLWLAAAGVAVLVASAWRTRRARRAA